jgi:hypothetical protein
MVNRYKISINFDVASKLVKSQQIKLLICQSKKLVPSEANIQNFVDFCQENNCLCQGLAYVLEYADCTDRAIDLIERILCESNVIFIRDFTTNPNLTDRRISAIFRLYLLTIKLCYIMIRWRQLQFQFSPVFIKINENNNLSFFEFLSKILGTFSDDFLLNEQNNQFMLSSCLMAFSLKEFHILFPQKNC